MKLGTILAALVGLALCAIAVVYWVEPAQALPGFLPGHEAGSMQHHIKHGILALALGVVCFVAAWFLSGPKPQASA